MPLARTRSQHLITGPRLLGAARRNRRTDGFCRSARGISYIRFLPSAETNFRLYPSSCFIAHDAANVIKWRLSTVIGLFASICLKAWRIMPICPELSAWHLVSSNIAMIARAAAASAAMLIRRLRACRHRRQQADGWHELARRRCQLMIINKWYLINQHGDFVANEETAARRPSAGFSSDTAAIIRMRLRNKLSAGPSRGLPTMK